MEGFFFFEKKKQENNDGRWISSVILIYTVNKSGSWRNGQISGTDDHQQLQAPDPPPSRPPCIFFSKLFG